MPSMRRAFSMIVWYLLRSVEIVKDIDVLWDVVFVIYMIYGSMRGMEVKDSKKYEIITAGEVVKVAFQEERFCKRRVWRCV